MSAINIRLFLRGFRCRSTTRWRWRSLKIARPTPLWRRALPPCSTAMSVLTIQRPDSSSYVDHSTILVTRWSLHHCHHLLQ